MIKIHPILKDREKRAAEISKMTASSDVVCLKANLPGENKNRSEAYFLISRFASLIKVPGEKKRICGEGADGPYILYLFPKGNGENLKKAMTMAEDTDPLGRLVDIDVYVSGEGSIRSGRFRKCLICDHDAFYCSRLKRHSDGELFAVIDKMITEEAEKNIRRLIMEAIEAELSLPYKFGAVGFASSGSHTDMSWETMMKAARAIVPFFGDMFRAGTISENQKKLFRECRKIGLEAERAMYEATSNVNCYKGLIFLLGLLTASLGLHFKHLNGFYRFGDVFENIRVMTEDVGKEAYDPGYDSFGNEAYRKYGFGGARKEAMSGMPNVMKGFSFLKKEKMNTETAEILLTDIIGWIDDTSLLKRSGNIATYKAAKEKITGISRERIMKGDFDELRETNEWATKLKLSPGGACDILVCSLFLKFLDGYIKTDGV